MIIQIFVLWSSKGRCYGNQLNLGDVRKRRVERPVLFALAFDNVNPLSIGSVAIIGLHHVQIW